MVSKKLIVVTFILAAATALSLFFYLDGLEKAADTTEYVSLVVAKSDIRANTTITGEQLVYQQVPKDYAHPLAMRQMEDVIGAIAGDSFAAGEVILQSRLIQPGDTGKGLAYVVPEGQRALTIPINPVSGLDNMIIPGDRVDVIITMDFEKEGPNGKEQVTQTKTLLQNSLVLAVGRRLDTTRDSNNGEASTVTLAVTPEEAQRLVMASERGTLRLLLRSPVDQKVNSLPAIIKDDLLERR